MEEAKNGNHATVGFLLLGVVTQGETALGLQHSFPLSEGPYSEVVKKRNLRYYIPDVNRNDFPPGMYSDIFLTQSPNLRCRSSQSPQPLPVTELFKGHVFDLSYALTRDPEDLAGLLERMI